MNNSRYQNDSTNTIASVIGVFLVCGLIYGISGCTSVGSSDVGVETHFGKVTDVSVAPGLHWVNPIGGKIVKYDARTLLMKGTTESFTKDMQQAEIQYGVNYKIDRARGGEVHVNYGSEYAKVIIEPIVISTMKNIIGQCEAEHLINHRDEASASIMKSLAEHLENMKYPFSITSFSIYDIGYSDKFEKAIEEKVVAQQEALRAKNKTIQIEEEAKQTEVKAKGEAEALKLRATAEAESMKIRANALKENQNLVVLEFVNKWDGKLPTFLGASDMTQALMKDVIGTTAK